MVKTLKAPSKGLHKRQSEDKHFEGQLKRVFGAFSRKPSTMLMVSVETGIFRANICRYVARWQKQGSIHLMHKGLCKVSKHRAGYYTTDTSLFTQPLTLF